MPPSGPHCAAKELHNTSERRAPPSLNPIGAGSEKGCPRSRPRARPRSLQRTCRRLIIRSTRRREGGSRPRRHVPQSEVDRASTGLIGRRSNPWSASLAASFSFGDEDATKPKTGCCRIRAAWRASRPRPRRRSPGRRARLGRDRCCRDRPSPCGARAHELVQETVAVEQIDRRELIAGRRSRYRSDFGLSAGS